MGFTGLALGSMLFRDGAAAEADSVQLLEGSKVERTDDTSTLTCRIPIQLDGEGDKDKGFYWSTTEENQLIVAWGDDNTFGWHGGSNRAKDLPVPPLQPLPVSLAAGDAICVEGFVMVRTCA